MDLLIRTPALALVPFALFIVLYLLRRKRMILIVALSWALYVPYEFGMKLRVLCTGECNIRVDLLLIYPVLLALSVLAAVAALRSGSTRK